MLTIALKDLDGGLELPHRAYAGDGAVDLRSTIDIDLKPFERALVPTGIAVAIPEGYAGLVIPRSGLALKHGISLVNAPGLIDSNYRGEIGAIVVNLDPQETFHIERGMRIAQLSIVGMETVSFELVEALDDTCRNAGGFGSSGKN